MARRSIYSRRQSMPAGTYETPLADFLDALPQYINQYQQNQLALKRQELAEQRYQDEIDYRNERNRIADERYNADLLREKNKYDDEQQLLKDQIELERIKINNKEKSDRDKLIYEGFTDISPELGLNYLINKGKVDQDSNVASLISLNEERKTFNDELEFLQQNVNEFSSPRDIAKNQLRLKDFFKKYENSLFFKNDSPAYIQLLNKKDKLDRRASQIPFGFLSPDDYASFNPLSGDEDSGEVKTLLDERSDIIKNKQAYSEKGSTPNKVMFDIEDKRLKQVDNRIQEIRSRYRVDTLSNLESNRGVFGKLDALMQMNPAGAQSMASAVSSIPSDIISDQPAITESEMDDVSNQIAMNQKQVEDNLAIINEDVPVVVDAQQPIQSPEIINEIQDTNELQDLPQDTESNFILDRVLPDRVSATESVDRDESSLPPLDMGLEEDMTEQIEPIQKEIKQVSEFKSNKAKNNPAAFASDLGSGRNPLVKKLFNLVSEYEEADLSKESRRLNSLSNSIQQLSKQISNKIGDFIDPQTGDFSDSDYTNKFYTQLSRDTGVSVSKLKDTLKRLAS